MSFKFFTGISFLLFLAACAHVESHPNLGLKTGPELRAPASLKQKGVGDVGSVGGKTHEVCHKVSTDTGSSNQPDLVCNDYVIDPVIQNFSSAQKEELIRKVSRHIDEKFHPGCDQGHSTFVHTISPDVYTSTFAIVVTTGSDDECFHGVGSWHQQYNITRLVNLKTDTVSTFNFEEEIPADDQSSIKKIVGLAYQLIYDGTSSQVPWDKMQYVLMNDGLSMAVFVSDYHGTAQYAGQPLLQISLPYISKDNLPKKSVVLKTLQEIAPN